jgi:hypothetical protein
VIKAEAADVRDTASRAVRRDQEHHRSNIGGEPVGSRLGGVRRHAASTPHDRLAGQLNAGGNFVRPDIRICGDLPEFRVESSAVSTLL